MAEITNFITTALEASIYADPAAPGLTLGELAEVGRTYGYLTGELREALKHVPLDRAYGHGARRVPDCTDVASFTQRRDPDFRDPGAFELVQSGFQGRAREVGLEAAQIGRDTLLADARDQGIDLHEVEVAIAVFELGGHLQEKDGLLHPTRRGVDWCPVRKALEHAQAMDILLRPLLGELMPIVGDVVARRTDGRPKAPEPLDAFQHELMALGHVPSVKFISPVPTITSPQVAGGLGGAQPHQFLMLPTS